MLRFRDQYHIRTTSKNAVICTSMQIPHFLYKTITHYLTASFIASGCLTTPRHGQQRTTLRFQLSYVTSSCQMRSEGDRSGKTLAGLHLYDKAYTFILSYSLQQSRQTCLPLRTLIQLAPVFSPQFSQIYDSKILASSGRLIVVSLTSNISSLWQFQ